MNLKLVLVIIFVQICSGNEENEYKKRSRDEKFDDQAYQQARKLRNQEFQDRGLNLDIDIDLKVPTTTTKSPPKKEIRLFKLEPKKPGGKDEDRKLIVVAHQPHGVGGKSSPSSPEDHVDHFEVAFDLPGISADDLNGRARPKPRQSGIDERYRLDDLEEPSLDDLDGQVMEQQAKWRVEEMNKN